MPSDNLDALLKAYTRIAELECQAKEKFSGLECAIKFHTTYPEAHNLEQANIFIAELNRQLEEHIKRIAELKIQLKEKQTSTVLDSRRRESYLKLIAASLCTDGKKEELEKRGLATELAQRTEHLGFPLSDDTVRNIIKEVLNIII